MHGNGKKEVIELYWSYGPEFTPLSDSSRHYTDMNLHVKTMNYNPGESITVYITYPTARLVTIKTEQIKLTGTVNEKGEAVFINPFENESISLNWRA